MNKHCVYYPPGKVISRRKALAGLWQASESKSSSTVPTMVKKMPQGWEWYTAEELAASESGSG